MRNADSEVNTPGRGLYLARPYAGGDPGMAQSMTKTFLLLQLDSEGAPYSEVAEVLEDLGFRAEREGYDFVYDWGRPVAVSESLSLADRIQEALKGKRVSFRIESTED